MDKFVASVVLLHVSVGGALVLADDRGPFAADETCVYAYVPETGRKETVCGVQTEWPAHVTEQQHAAAVADDRPAGERAVPEDGGDRENSDNRPDVSEKKPEFTYCDVCRPPSVNPLRNQRVVPVETVYLLDPSTGGGGGGVHRSSDGYYPTREFDRGRFVVHGTPATGDRKPDFVLRPAIVQRPRVADLTRFHNGYKAPYYRTFDVIKPIGPVLPNVYKTHIPSLGHCDDQPPDRQYNAAMIQLQMFNGLPKNAEGRTASLLLNNPLVNVGGQGAPILGAQFVINEIGHDMLHLIRSFGINL